MDREQRAEGLQINRQTPREVGGLAWAMQYTCRDWASAHEVVTVTAIQAFAGMPPRRCPQVEPEPMDGIVP